MPSAPFCAPSSAPCALPTLATTSTRWPSRVMAASAAPAAAASCCSCHAFCRALAAANACSSGSTVTVPCRPSTMTVVPLAMSSTLGPAPTTAGRRKARAMMAAWPVGPPTAVQKPSTTPPGPDTSPSAAVSDGERSEAMITAGSAGNCCSLAPVSWRNTRRPMSRRSAARSASRGSPSAATCRARCSTTLCQACGALVPSLILPATASARSGSSSRSLCTSKMAASSGAFAAIFSRRCASSSRLAAMACSKRFCSAAGSSVALPLPEPSSSSCCWCRWKTGPMAMPGAAGMAETTSPGDSGRCSLAAGVCALASSSAGAGRVWPFPAIGAEVSASVAASASGAAPSPKPERMASSRVRMASTSSSPSAVIQISAPFSAPRVSIEMRLLPLAFFSP